ncbi:MAG: hypothetical protein R3D00_04755 [Bacteroidia bacterium]
MRLMVPGLNAGKSGGYRLIYKAEVIDEIYHIVFLRIYFKGDLDDLTAGEYRNMIALSEEILSDTLSYDWEE